MYLNKKIRVFFIYLISSYQRFLSPDSGFLKKIIPIKNSTCVFYPSCSEYAKQAIEKYGVIKGLYLGFIRILRCHPWQKNHIDPLK